METVHNLPIPQLTNLVIDESRNHSNTDWIGIRNLLVDTLKSRGLASKPQELTALVMGGGGTARAACYALQQMKVGNLHVYNRSTEKVSEASLSFPRAPRPLAHSLPRYHSNAGRGPRHRVWRHAHARARRGRRRPLASRPTRLVCPRLSRPHSTARAAPGTRHTPPSITRSLNRNPS